MTLSTPALRKLATDALIRGNLFPLCAIRGETLICMNERCAKLLGRSGEEADHGLSLREMVADADWHDVSRRLQNLMDHPGSAGSVRICTRRKDGSVADLEFSGAAVGQDECVLVSIIADVSERSRLSVLAFHDALTGLPNRALFFDRFRQAMVASRRDGRGFAVLACDLDGFKVVNDIHGHEIGDVVLQVAAERLRSCCREVDTAARMGGDEFALILPGVVDRSHAATVAKRIIKAFERPIEVAGISRTIGISIGIVFYPRHAQSVDLLLRAADMALYSSKAGGKNRFSFAAVAPRDSAGPSSNFVNWSEFHLTGIAMVDEQHRALTTMIETLGLHLASGEDIERVRASLRVLIDHAQAHFAEEEALMERYRIDDRLSHAHSHGQLLRDANQFAAALDESSVMLITVTLRDWLLRHIDTADKGLARQLRAKGVGEPRPRRNPGAAVPRSAA